MKLRAQEKDSEFAETYWKAERGPTQGSSNSKAKESRELIYITPFDSDVFYFKKEYKQLFEGHFWKSNAI